MNISFRALSLKMLRRDFYVGELNLLFVAIVMSVVIVTSITLFAERLQGALVSEAKVFLAADMVIKTSQPLPPTLFSTVQRKKYYQNLQQAQLVQFASMVFAGDEMSLASVKAVSSAYPLLGSLEVRAQDSTESVAIDEGPNAGEAWLDKRLLLLLNIKLGDKIWVGEKALTATRILTREPDSGSSYYSLGPRVLFHLDDLANTQIIQPGSRVEYRYLFSGEEKDIKVFTDWLEPLLTKHQKLMTLDESQPGLASSLRRAESFLLLAGSIAVLLASIAIAMASRRYSLRHFDSVAVMKTLGLTPTRLGRMLIEQLSTILLFSILIGWAIGWFAQYTFLQVMQEWLPEKLPAVSLKPFLMGATTALICTLAFSLPLLWNLRSVSPLRVLRREVGIEGRSLLWVYLLGAIAIFLLMLLYSKNIVITGLVFGGTLFCALFVGFLAWLLLRSVTVVNAQVGGIWRLAVSNLQRNQVQTVLQLLVFGLALMFLLVSILIRTSILSEWQLQLPPETPNHFLINIAPYQLEPLQKLLDTEQLNTVGLHPMVRGRLLTVKGVDIAKVVREGSDEIERELNLTWSETLPEDNVLSAGEWWNEENKNTSTNADGAVSIEQGLAKRLQVEVGDTVTFSFANKTLTAHITSIRELSWDRMRPNFYFIFQQKTLKSFPVTYTTSFYLPKNKKYFLNELLKQFPTITVFEVDEIILRIQKTVDQVSRSIELVLGLILLSGTLVLIACVQASMDQRIHENAIMRTLGASKKLILGSLSIEFFLLGLGAGLMAAFGAELTAWGLQTQVFKMEYQWHAWLWLAGPILGIGIIMLLGLLSSAKVVRVPPVVVLRDLR